MYIYIGLSGSLARADKNGGGKLEYLPVSPSGFPHQNFLVDDTHLYWLSGTAVTKYNKSTSQTTQLIFQDTPPEPLDHEANIHVMTMDEERIYLASMGCALIISMTKNGEDRKVSTLERTGDIGGSVNIAVGDTYVYCSGGVSGSTAGKMYLCPKLGGEVSLATTVPNSDNNSGSQVGPMFVLADKVYYINNYAGNYWIQRLTETPALGGESTVLVELENAKDGYRLHFNEARSAFYWVARGNPDMVKYNFITKKLTRIEIDGMKEPIAWDEEYLYWPTMTSFYRMKKF